MPLVIQHVLTARALSLLLQVQTFREKASHQERRGPAVETLQDSDLFVFDTAPDEQQATAKAQGKKPRKAVKPLRSQLILQAAANIKPVIPPRERSSQLKQQKPNQQQQLKALVQTQQAVVGGKTKLLVKKRRGQLDDVWADDENEASTSGNDGWLETRPPLALAAQAGRKRPRTHQAAPLIKSVEVDRAGCSYNPDPELHQVRCAACRVGWTS